MRTMMVIFFLVFSSVATAVEWEGVAPIKGDHNVLLLSYNAGLIRTLLDERCGGQRVTCQVAVPTQHGKRSLYAEQWYRQCMTALDEARRTGDAPWSIHDLRASGGEWLVAPGDTVGAILLCEAKSASAEPLAGAELEVPPAPKAREMLEQTVERRPLEPHRPTAPPGCLGISCIVGISASGQFAAMIQGERVLGGSAGPGFWLRGESWDVGLRAEFGGSSSAHQRLWVQTTLDGGWELIEGLNLGAFVAGGVGVSQSLGWVTFGPRLRLHPFILAGGSYLLAVELDGAVFGRQFTAATADFTAGDQGRGGVTLLLRQEFALF